MAIVFDLRLGKIIINIWLKKKKKKYLFFTVESYLPSGV